MRTDSFNCYIVTVTVSSLLTIITNNHLQQFACNEEMEMTRLFKHEERCTRYNFLGAQDMVTM
jgi:hypothetical protein